ncbi:MAG TPA: SAM-dependent methyltransferase [Jatrophihabitans sp.]|nr:SAM-dependent methyltransferase [Jatrophihabitans sp.]
MPADRNGAAAHQDLDYVEAMYAGSDDPWRIESGFYEQRRMELILACLPRARYRRGFEPACAGGRLTERLAGRCDHLLAADVSARAVELTRARVPAAEVSQLALPAQWPAGRFDLVVLSEFGYYLTPEAWQQTLAQVAASLSTDWTVLTCHWRHPFTERLIDTDELHAELARQLPGRRVLALADDDVTIEVWSADPLTVAQHDQR